MCYFGKNILGRDASLLVGQNFFSFRSWKWFRKQRWQSIYLPSAALEIKHTFYLRRVSEVCKKEFGSYRVSRIIISTLANEEAERNIILIIKKYQTGLRPSSGICCGGAPAAGG